MKAKLAKIDIEHTDTEGSWAISYGDMITLLLSFFVIFFSFDFKEEKESKLELSAMKSVALMDSAINKEIGLSSSKSETLDDLNNIQTIVEKDSTGKIFVFFKGANFFNSGDTDVNPVGENLLKKFASKFMPFAGKYRVKIQAFTDSTPILSTTSRFKDNVELSALRSVSVMRFLQQVGLPLNRVEIGGKGVMSKRTLKLLGVDSKDNFLIKKMSRTVALIIYREDAS